MAIHRVQEKVERYVHFQMIFRTDPSKIIESVKEMGARAGAVPTVFLLLEYPKLLSEHQTESAVNLFGQLSSDRAAAFVAIDKEWWKKTFKGMSSLFTSKPVVAEEVLHEIDGILTTHCNDVWVRPAPKGSSGDGESKDRKRKRDSRLESSEIEGDNEDQHTKKARAIMDPITQEEFKRLDPQSEEMLHLIMSVLKG